MSQLESSEPIPETESVPPEADGLETPEAEPEPEPMTPSQTPDAAYDEALDDAAATSEYRSDSAP